MYFYFEIKSKLKNQESTKSFHKYGKMFKKLGKWKIAVAWTK